MFELQHSTPPFLYRLPFNSSPAAASNYFKVISALIAGRCFSGGQVPGGASPVTHSIPALCAVPSPLPPPHRLSLPGARLSLNTTESLQVLSCSSAGTAEPVNPDYWFTATPLLKTRFGPNGGAPSSFPYERNEKLMHAVLF